MPRGRLYAVVGSLCRAENVKVESACSFQLTAGDNSRTWHHEEVLVVCFQRFVMEVLLPYCKITVLYCIRKYPGILLGIRSLLFLISSILYGSK